MTTPKKIWRFVQMNLSMKTIISTFAFLMFGVLGAAAEEGGKPAAAVECPIDEEHMMQLAPEAFDQDIAGGWRKVAAIAGCEQAAADLIGRYIEKNWGRIGQRSLHVMYWHAGQLKAVAGDDRAAIPLLMAGVAPIERSSAIGFQDYALGTIAFLNRDLDGLKAARQRLSALPEPAWAKERGFQGWPPNLGVLDGLIRCFGSSYAVAYGGRCPESKAQP